MRPALGLLFAALLGLPAGAQDWATAEVCAVETPQVHEDVFAPASHAELQAEAANIPNALGKFWRITAPNGAVSHLFGTFHSADPSILRLPEPVTAAIAEARIVAVEVDYTFKSRDAFRDAQLMPGRFNEAADPFAFAPGDGSVAGLPEEMSSWVRDRAVELGWTEDFDLVMSLPGIAEMLLSDPCEDFASGVLPIQDDYIQLLGRLDHADILGLEAPDEMIADLAASEETARALIHTYAAYLKPVHTNRERATTFALYLEGRLGLLTAWDRAFQAQVHGDAGLRALEATDEYLLDRRNRRFVERLSGEFAEGGVLVAVGAAHIPGEAGLVALLREAGYDVNRVVLPGEAR